jgi:competence protein ComEC
VTELAPIVRLALLYGVGVAVGLAGATMWLAPLGLLIAVGAPIRACGRIRSALLYAAVVAAGWSAAGISRQVDRRCTQVEMGRAVTVSGHLLATPRAGSAPFELDSGCGVVTLVLSQEAGGDDLARPTSGPSVAVVGRPLEVRGIWQPGRRRAWLRARSVAVRSAPVASLRSLRWAGVRWRDGLVARLHRLYPTHGPLIAALVFARREGLDRDLQASFAVTGIAHLLAISGVHVGLIAALLFAAARAVKPSQRGAAVTAAGGSWAYVAFIGFPDAATRAALIISCVAASRWRGYPPSRWGPLAAAGLLLIATDPSRLSGAGFQLSFAGAAGLVAWARPVEQSLGDTLSRHAPPSIGERIPASLVSGVAAGLAATLATLPIVAWHFERVSLVGIPVTLAATPLVSLALPGALLTLLLDFGSEPFGSFLAGGVATLLEALVRLTTLVGGWPWVAAWTARPTVLATCAGVFVAIRVARSPGVGARARRRLTLAYATAFAIGWPALLSLEARAHLEVVMIDVGQGDAIAVRTPGNRWVLVDAGPPPTGDDGGHPVVRALRSRGVHRIETLVLTHPDLDHIGGASAVIAHLDPARIVDPLLAAPKAEYAELVEMAASRGIRWSGARAGQIFELDGVVFRVLHPDGLPRDSREGNAASVVLLVSWGDFSALLTGDAYVDVERAIAAEAGDVDVLKVGHHGSTTSTDSTFLAKIRPEVALVSVGRRNRYGHPDPGVLRRLEASGARVYRTDRHGTVRVVAARGGTFRISTSATGPRR